MSSNGLSTKKTMLNAKYVQKLQWKTKWNQKANQDANRFQSNEDII